MYFQIFDPHPLKDSKIACRPTGNQFALLFPLPTNVNNYYYMQSVKCPSYGCISSTKSFSFYMVSC